MRRSTRRIFSLLLLGVFLALVLPFPAAAATRVVYQISVNDFSGLKAFSKLLGSFQQSEDWFWNFSSAPKLFLKIRIQQPQEDFKYEEQPAQEAGDAVPTQEKETTPGLHVLTLEEKQMLDLVNRERLRAGLQPLVVDPKLVQLARLKSKDMVEKGYFGHYSPTYGSPFAMMDSFGVSYRYAGENLAGAPTVEIAHRSLMNSPGHRANILNPNFQRIGIGIITGGPYGKMFTQMFAG
ncbi:MAG: Uncharacterized protein XD63_1397 [Thermoanaerobacterales bacterium 50_218]|nr:MAG: Uncharacterized protein XD63_1397 [Thermoanaerobacterales bacterium 50_218]HAA89759.1 sporulation protein [Peptococcaceae bacterium]